MSKHQGTAKALSDPSAIQVNGTTIAWDAGGHGLKFLGIDSIIFWLNPSLASILLPIREELGEPLFCQLISYEASKGTHEDYGAMMQTQFKNFEEGFAGWAHCVVAAGWGEMVIESVDWDNKTAVLVIHNPWELKITRATDTQYEIPFLQGKLSGIFSHAFKTNCISVVNGVKNIDGKNSDVTITISPSSTTLEQRLFDLQASMNASGREGFRAANNALRRNERRLLDVAETVGEFIWECDPYLNFTYATKRAQSIFGLSDEEMIGKNWSEFLNDSENSHIIPMLQQMSQTKSFVEKEFLFKRPGAEPIWILLRAKVVFDANGNRIGYVGSGSDVSDRKKLQSDLLDQRKNSEFASKMASLGEMASGMAHEINTPLAVITLWAEHLTLELGADSPHLETAQIILDTSARIGKIVSGLKSFARDANEDDKTQVPVVNLINDTLTLCQNRFNNNSVSLKIGTIPADLKLNCRPTQICQVLLNLLNNAFDAAVKSDEKWIELSVALTKDGFRLSLTDSGAGIDEKIADKIMQPFFTTKPVGQGTGLGLSISKGIVEDHGGTLVLDKSCRNTRFVLNFPIG